MSGRTSCDGAAGRRRLDDDGRVVPLLLEFSPFVAGVEEEDDQ